MNFTRKLDFTGCDSAFDSDIRMLSIDLQSDAYYYVYYSPRTMVGDKNYNYVN